MKKILLFALLVIINSAASASTSTLESSHAAYEANLLKLTCMNLNIINSSYSEILKEDFKETASEYILCKEGSLLKENRAATLFAIDRINDYVFRIFDTTARMSESLTKLTSETMSNLMYFRNIFSSSSF